MTQKVLAGFGVVQRYLLCIGTVELRKNLVRLIEAFDLVVEQCPEYQLVWRASSGGTTNLLSRRWQHPGIVSVLYILAICRRKKRVLLTGAMLLVYASLYEGFGLQCWRA